MYKKYLPVLLVIILSLGAAIISVYACAEEAEQGVEGLEPGTESRDPMSMESLMKTVSINDSALETEAERLGIPESETKRYVVRMKAINQEYQDGLLTRTEYIGIKRNLIENLK